MWFNYLKSNWNHSDRLLLIQTNPDSNGPDPSLSLIQDLEANIKEFNLNKWILSDRGLKGVNHQLSIRMLARFANELSSHLKKHHIDYLIGELTFSIELVAYYIARQSGVKFLYPDSIKIPSNRFAFFETPYYGDEFLKKVPKKVIRKKPVKCSKNGRKVGLNLTSGISTESLPVLNGIGLKNIFNGPENLIIL